MKKIFASVVLLFITCFLIWKLGAQYFEVVSNEAHSENMESLKMEIKSENDRNKNKKISMEFNNELHTLCQSSIEYEKLVKSIDNYVQRYVSLFLITSNLLVLLYCLFENIFNSLQNHKIKDLSENVTINLEISVSGEDLLYLQEFSRSTKDSSYQKNFSKLDAILSKIARLKKESYMESAMKSFWSCSESFNIFSILKNHDFSHFISFSIILFMTWMVYYYNFYKYLLEFVLIFTNSMILWESLQLYWRKIKEANMESYVNTLQSEAMPECDPTKIRWYHRIVDFYSGNRCLLHYKNLIKNPADEISLLKCVIDTYSFYFFQTPFRIFGASLRDFTEEISVLWPWPFNYLTNIPIASFFGAAVLLVIVILCGKRLKVSFWGAGLEIGDVKEKRSAISNEKSKREPVPVFQKLKPGAKTRFRKRLDADLARRRKLFLKPSKSVSEVLDEPNKLNFNVSSESLCDYKMKYK